MSNIIWTEKGTFIINSHFDRSFVDWLRANIPKTDKTWHPEDKEWEVAARHVDAVEAVMRRTYGYVTIKGNQPKPKGPERMTFILDYIGQLKLREDGSAYSTGCANGEKWNVIFPSNALEQFFSFQISSTASMDNHYVVLGLDRSADETAVKKAYRRAARTWHPDVCSEPDAKQMFERVKLAYDILSDDTLRKKYNAALQLAAGVDASERDQEEALWKPPIKCGELTVMAEDVGRLLTREILSWEDQVNALGQTRVTYWDKDLPGQFGFWAERWEV